MSRKPKPPEQMIDGPAIVTALHAQNRELSTIAGAAKGFRRIDRLQWLKDHGTIAEHQFFAGRRLQEDWQQSKIENCPSMSSGGSGGPKSTLADGKLDAMARVGKAMAIIPQDIKTLLTLFLLPEDEPFSLERCAALVRLNRAAAALGIRVGLSLLARHYGYST